MDTKTLNTFKETRKALLDGYTKAKAELATLEKELIAEGVIQSTQPTAPKELILGNADVKSGSREEKIIKALANGPLTEKEIKKITKLSGINSLLNKMVKDGKLVSDGLRPAKFSIKG